MNSLIDFNFLDSVEICVFCDINGHISLSFFKCRIFFWIYGLNFNTWLFPSVPEIEPLDRHADGQQSDLIRVSFILKRYGTLKIDQIS